MEKKNDLIDLSFSLQTELVSITLEQGTRTDFYRRSTPGKSVIFCPPDADLTTPERQEWLRLVIVRTLRQQAEWLLLPRLRELSELHNLPFNKSHIRACKTRWGSCSSCRDIMLSCYLVTQPPHLIDYVILHELAHTKEMNHGPHFWALLDTLTDGKAKALRNEMKHARVVFF